MWSSILTVLGQAVSGFFGLKKNQAEAIKQAMEIVQSINLSDDARAVAAAQIIAAEARSESWFVRNLRPMISAFLFGCLIANYFGYLSAPNIKPEDLAWMRELTTYYLTGYMGLRSIDKWVRELSLGGVLKKFIEKKL